METIFCQKRATPLKIGSIKSNIGHCEGASGMCSISKIILSFELGVILPNIHFEKPRSDIIALHNGNISVSVINLQNTVCTLFRLSLHAYVRVRH